MKACHGEFQVTSPTKGNFVVVLILTKLQQEATSGVTVVFVIWKRPLNRLDALRGFNTSSLPSLTASLRTVIAGGTRSLPQRVPGGWHGESFQGRVNGQLVVR
jgi:hypothetical protein